MTLPCAGSVCADSLARVVLPSAVGSVGVVHTKICFINVIFILRPVQMKRRRILSGALLALPMSSSSFLLGTARTLPKCSLHRLFASQTSPANVNQAVIENVAIVNSSTVVPEVCALYSLQGFAVYKYATVCNQHFLCLGVRLLFGSLPRTDLMRLSLKLSHTHAHL